jgi:hypothetical protein
MLVHMLTNFAMVASDDELGRKLQDIKLKGQPR